MAIIFYKKKKRFKFKKKNLINLIRILGYNLKKKRFKYYLLNYKIPIRTFRRSKQWRVKRTDFIYSNIINKNKKRNLFIQLNKFLFRRLKFKKKYNEIKIIRFLWKIIYAIRKIKLMSRKEKKNYLKKKNNMIFYKSFRKKILKRIKKYLKKKKKYNYNLRLKSLIKFKNKKRNSIKNKQLYTLILKHSNNNFFITINNYKNRTLWHRSAGQFFESEKHNIKLKRSHLLINEMIPFIKEKINELKIKYVKLYLKSNISRHIYKIMNFIVKQNIKVYLIKFIKPMPHHRGSRKKKLKRR